MYSVVMALVHPYSCPGYYKSHKKALDALPYDNVDFLLRRLFLNRAEDSSIVVQIFLIITNLSAIV